MHYVVDSNYLTNPKLRDYLTASKNNKVVIIDFVMMEAYKNHSIPLMNRLMAIICEFKEQIIILKGTTAIGTLKGRKAGLIRRMISQESMTDFQTFCSTLKLAAQGNKGAIKSFEEHAKSADEHFQKSTQDLNNLTISLQQLASTFTKDELKNIRFDKERSLETSKKLAGILMIILDKFFESHPLRPKRPKGPEILNTFIFRSAVAALIFILGWIRLGMQKQISAKKHGNDIVDMVFAVYGTYFDGILTDDQKLLGVYEELKVALEAFGKVAK